MEWSFDKTCYRRIYDYDKRRNRPVDALLEKGHPEILTAQELLSTLISIKKNCGGIVDGDVRSNCRGLLNRLKNCGVLGSKVECASLDAFVEGASDVSINMIERDATRLMDSVVDAALASIEVPSSFLIHRNEHNHSFFQLDDSPEQYFACRILQQQLRHVYGIKASNRDQVVSQLTCVLQDSYPKIVVKADIKSFYESVDLTHVIECLKKDQLLDRRSICLLQSLENAQKALGQDKGLPRGVGVSAYLAEYRMRGFDRRMRQLDGLVYHARYVDDIILVFPYTTDFDKAGLAVRMKKALGDVLDLEFHADEPAFIDWLDGDGKTHSFSYLGYSFTLEKDKLIVGIADMKVDKLKKRIDNVFTRFFIERDWDVPLSKRIKLIYWRMRCLTDSYILTLLPHSSLVLGIKRSYSAISPDYDEAFIKLDDYLEVRIKESHLPEYAKKALSTLSFKEGWRKKPVRLAPHILREVLECWQPVNIEEAGQCLE